MLSLMIEYVRPIEVFVFSPLFPLIVHFASSWFVRLCIQSIAIVLSVSFALPAGPKLEKSLSSSND